MKDFDDVAHHARWQGILLFQMKEIETVEKCCLTTLNLLKCLYV